MKKLMSIVLIVIITLFTYITVLGNTNTAEQPYAIACINDNALYFNGSKDKQSNAPIIDENSGCMMLPVEWIKQITGMDYEVLTEPMMRDKVIFHRNTLQLSVQLGSEILEAEVYRSFYPELDLMPSEQSKQLSIASDGSITVDWYGEFTLGTEVRRGNETICIPVRKLLEILGYTVEWKEEINGINIYEPDYDELVKTEFYYDPNVNFNKDNKIRGSVSYIIKNNGYLPIVKRSDNGQEYYWNICAINGKRVVKDHNEYSEEEKHIVIAPHSVYNSSGGSGVSSETYQAGYLPEGKYYENCWFTKNLDYAGTAVKMPPSRVYFDAPKSIYLKEISLDEETETKSEITRIKAMKSNSEKTNDIFLNIKKSADNNTIEELLSDFEFEYIRQMKITGSYLLKFNSIEEADRAVDILNASNDINYAEPNYLYKID